MKIFSKYPESDTPEERFNDVSTRVEEATMPMPHGAEPEELQNASLQTEDGSVWEIVSKWGVYLIALLVPLWFLPLTINPVESNKLFLVSVLVMVSFVAWLGMAVYMGALRVPRFFPFYMLGLWLAVYFLASFFSISPGVSFWGSSATSFFYILVGALVAFMAAVSLRTIQEIRRAYTYALIAAAAVALFMFVQSVLSIDIFQWEFAKLRTFNPVGGWNTIGIFFGFIAVSLMPLISGGEMEKKRRIFTSALFVVSLILAAVVNFRMVWIGTAIISVVFLAYYYLHPGEQKNRMNVLVAPLILLLVSVLLYLSKDMISALTIAINPPLDVTPSVSSSLQIGRSILQNDPIFGVGPNFFGYAWDQFKDPAVNTTVFWRLRFGTGSSFATTLPTTTGILGVFGFLVFIFSALWAGFSLLGKLLANEEHRQFASAFFFGFLFLLYSLFVYPLSVVTLVMFFLLFGLLIAEAGAAGIITYSVFSIRADSAKGFVAALVIIFLMVFGVVGLYVTSQKHVAAILYGRGVALFDKEGSVNGAEAYFRRASAFDNRELYHRAITQMSAIKLRRSLENAAQLPPEDVRNEFQVALSSAIKSAQAATDANPGAAINWQLLGQVYGSVIPYVGGSADAAVEAYVRAIERAPQDPILRDDIARVYIALGDHVKARESLEEAIRIKSDYAAAHFRLAQIAAIKGNVGDAIANTERAAVSAPNDIGILFQLGLLYYQQNRTREAQAVFERAVTISPNYSNARYFLGLTYAARDDATAAIEQFERIFELNPNNTEVELILANLQAGKDPLAGIGTSPLNREQIPVGKESEELGQEDVLKNPVAGEDVADEEDL